MAVPAYESVPEHWKAPMGPYHQAPAEFGGKWYYVSPFTGPEPWNREKPVANLPGGFPRAFGPRPLPSDKHRYGEWNDNLENWGGIVNPVSYGHTAEEVSAAVQQYIDYGMGEPVFFKNRYGAAAIFPKVRDTLSEYFTPGMQGVLRSVGQTIAHFQTNMLEEDKVPEKIHFMTPLQLIPTDQNPVNPT